MFSRPDDDDVISKVEQAAGARSMHRVPTNRSTGTTTTETYVNSAFTHGVVGTMVGGWFSGQPHFQALEAQEGVSFDFGSSQ